MADLNLSKVDSVGSRLLNHCLFSFFSGHIINLFCYYYTPIRYLLEDSKPLRFHHQGLALQDTHSITTMRFLIGLGALLISTFAIGHPYNDYETTLSDLDLGVQETTEGYSNPNVQNYQLEATNDQPCYTDVVRFLFILHSPIYVFHCQLNEMRL